MRLGDAGRELGRLLERRERLRNVLAAQQLAPQQQLSRSAPGRVGHDLLRHRERRRDVGLRQVKVGEREARRQQLRVDREGLPVALGRTLRVGPGVEHAPGQVEHGRAVAGCGRPPPGRPGSPGPRRVASPSWPASISRPASAAASPEVVSSFAARRASASASADWPAAPSAAARPTRAATSCGSAASFRGRARPSGRTRGGRFSRHGTGAPADRPRLAICRRHGQNGAGSSRAGLGPPVDSRWRGAC